jgi:hypothetical protein
MNKDTKFALLKRSIRPVYGLHRELTIVPAELDENVFEQIRQQVETQMIRGYEAADGYFEDNTSCCGK